MDNLHNIESALNLLLNPQPDSEDGILVIANQRGEIVEVNATFETQFGYARSEIVGKLITILMPARYLADHTKSFNIAQHDLASARHIGHTPTHKILAHGLCKGGEEKEIEITLGVILLGNALFFTATMKLLKSQPGWGDIK